MKKIFLILFLTGFCFADEQIFIQVRFSEKTEKGEYCDALYFTEAEYKTLKRADIEAKKAERVNNWKSVIESAQTAVPVEPTPEQLEEQKAALVEQIASLQTQVEAVEATISVKALEGISETVIEKKVVKE